MSDEDSGFLDTQAREFLFDLLGTSAPTGFEARCQRQWVDSLSDVADSIRTDAYGNAVAVVEGGEPTLAITGHVDEVGFVVRRVDENGFLHLSRIGGADRTISLGQHVTVHTRTERLRGVIGQTAIHLRDTDEDEVRDVDEQFVDIGASSRDEALDLVDVGDPITIATTATSLTDRRVTGRAMDNRVGIWAAAQTLRRAKAADVDATVYAVSTVQEEVGGNGAEMVGFDLDPDAALVVDVTHATDSPGVPPERETDVELGGGPVLRRGQPDHPALVDAIADVAAAKPTEIQWEAASNRTKTDANTLFVQQGGIPTANLGVPTRYMHTPVEVVDARDLKRTVELAAAFAERVQEFSPFGVDL